MIKRYTIRGAAIGGACGLVAQVALAVVAHVKYPGGVGLYTLVFDFVFVCIIAVAGATIGGVAGLFTGIVVKAFSRNKE